MRALGIFAVLTLFVAGCASGDAPATGPKATSIAGNGTTDPVDTPRPTAPPPSDQQPCPSSPCTERPVIFVHGHTGEITDAKTILDDYVKPGERFDKLTPVGTTDHQAWTAKSIPRRQWLFAFDYYLALGTDKALSYTSGQGRIGSDQSFACASPAGPGHIRGSAAVYDNDATHEYATDLAQMVESVLRATGATKVDIFAHSMGGLIARSYITYEGGAAKVGQAMFLSTPHLGVSFATTETAFNKAAEPWMTDHELAELERQPSFGNTKFSACGDNATDTWTNLLLAAESPVAGLPTYHCMRGDKDPIVDEASAKHPKCVDYQEVSGADHVGLPQTPEASAATRLVVGGFVTVSTQL